MTIGLHVSASGGAPNAIERALELKCENFQFFSRPPQGGEAPHLTDTIVDGFKHAMAESGLRDAIIHTPYFINLASIKKNIYEGSIRIIREELERASTLAVPYVVTHLGAAKGLDEQKALTLVGKGLQSILKGYKGSATLLLENAAGAGSVIGSDFSELRYLLDAVSDNAPVGICLDTCHLFASGYDLRTPAAVKKTFDAFDHEIGFERLQYIHANDSQCGLGENKDRHAHIGEGTIGVPGFKSILSVPELADVPIVIETPHDGKHITDLKKLKSYRP